MMVNYRRLVFIVFVLITALSPVMFSWMLELVFDYTGGSLTNGFAVFDGLIVYHVWMYIMFGCVWLLCVKVLYDMVRWELNYKIIDFVDKVLEIDNGG